MKALGFTNQFKRDFRKVIKRGCPKLKLDDLVLLLRKGEVLPERYCDHALAGNWKEHRECHIEPNWLLIYQTFEKEIHLVRTGTHAELFGN